MKLLRVVAVAVLGVIGWRAHFSTAWFIPTVKQYIDIEREVERFLATPTEQRKAEPVFTALRQLRRNWSRFHGLEHLMHYPWMMSDQQKKPDAPVSSTRVLQIAKQWTCARFADSLLEHLFTKYNLQRWLDWEGEISRSNDPFHAFALDAEDAIARFHEATQVEMALSLGENDQVVRLKYLELVQTCIARDYL